MLMPGEEGSPPGGVVAISGARSARGRESPPSSSAAGKRVDCPSKDKRLCGHQPEALCQPGSGAASKPGPHGAGSLKTRGLESQ